MSNETMTSLLFSSTALFGAGSDTLAVGDPAPNFSLKGSDGETYRLKDYKDKQAVVLAWFPRAFTPG